MNNSQIICIVVIILLILVVISIILFGNKSEKYIAEEVEVVANILEMYPEILAPTNTIHFMKFLDVLESLSRRRGYYLTRGQIRGILNNLAQGRITDISSDNQNSRFIDFLLTPNTIITIKKDLKYKIASSLKSIIHEFVTEGRLMGLSDDQIFNKITRALKSEIPIDIDSNEITILLKSIYNSLDLLRTSINLPQTSEFKNIYTILDNPSSRDRILNRFKSLISQ